MKSLIIPIILSFIVFYFVSVRAGLMSLSMVFLKFVYDLGLFSSIKFYRGNFSHSEVFYHDYQGEYKNIGSCLRKTCDIISKLKLEDDDRYSVIGIYYDDPKKVKDLKSCRAVYGISKRITDELKPGHVSKDKKEIEIEEYLTEKGFKKSVLPDTVSLTASFPFKFKMSMILGIIKFYSALTSNLKDENFKRSYGIKETKDFSSVEVYQKNEIKFYIPTKNQEKFILTSIPQPEYKN
jgi:hypothetical protein